MYVLGFLLIGWLDFLLEMVCVVVYIGKGGGKDDGGGWLVAGTFHSTWNLAS